MEQINGSAKLTVAACRNFNVKQPVQGSATVAVTHSGLAKVKSGSRGATIRLHRAIPGKSGRDPKDSPRGRPW